jgi:prepilin-type N-terminal cleavage/methylation domain-containing protein
MDNKQDKGFTLVELLIVIVILGILATVTVFAVRGITDQGKQNACATEEKTILTATEAYYAQNGVAPANFAAMVPGFLTDDPAVLAANWTSDSRRRHDGSERGASHHRRRQVRHLYAVIIQ